MGCNDDNDECRHNQQELINIQNYIQDIDFQINKYAGDVGSILANIQPVFLLFWINPKNYSICLFL